MRRADAAAVATREINHARGAILLILAALQRYDCDVAVLAAHRARRALAAAEIAVAQLSFDDARREHFARIVADLRRHTNLEAPLTELRAASEVQRLLAWNRDPEYVRPFEAEDALLACLDLDAIDLREANLTRSGLIDCRFLLACLEGVSFRNAVIESCDFASAKLTCASFCGACVRRCSFAGAALLDAAFDGATFVDCDFRGADLSVLSRSAFATSGGTSFYRCDLRDTIWDRRRLAGYMFLHCELEGARGVVANDDRDAFGANSNRRGKWN